MANETVRTKEEIVRHILKQETYTTDSRLYERTYSKLMKMPMSFLQDLELLIVIKVSESNELDRKV